MFGNIWKKTTFLWVAYQLDWSLNYLLQRFTFSMTIRDRSNGGVDKRICFSFIFFGWKPILARCTKCVREKTEGRSDGWLGGDSATTTATGVGPRTRRCCCHVLTPCALWPCYGCVSILAVRLQSPWRACWCSDRKEDGYGDRRPTPRWTLTPRPGKGVQ